MANFVFNAVFLVVLALIAALAAPAAAWWCTGHEVISEIARQRLNPGVEYKVNEVIGNLYRDGPFPMIPSMVPAACWADDLKSEGLTAMAGWHFINQAYIKDGFHPRVPTAVQKDNVAADIASLEETMKRNPNKWIASFAVANLIHFIGDVHQPLHATEMYSEKFPEGDHGGNMFHVYYNNTQWHLHMFWDSVCGRYPTEPTRPPTQAQSDWTTREAKWYLDQYKFTDEQINDHFAMDFAKESLDDAKQYAYGSLRPGDNLDDNYVRQCLDTAGKRITLAGYRLANELNYVFSDNNKHLQSADVIMKRVEQLKAMKKH